MSSCNESWSHVEAIEAVVLAKSPVSHAQLDAFWLYVGHKDEKGSAMKRHQA